MLLQYNFIYLINGNQLSIGILFNALHVVFVLLYIFLSGPHSHQPCADGATLIIQQNTIQYSLFITELPTLASAP